MVYRYVDTEREPSPRKPPPSPSVSAKMRPACSNVNDAKGLVRR